MDLRDQLQHTLGTTFTLERELGGGGMSRVFVAEEMRLGRKVVVKVLTPELSASISADRFEREIRLAASLQQANIVPLLSAGETDGLPYYTMPYVEGESLRHYLQKSGAMPVAEAINVLRDVARALAYAHHHGIVHRDIKPDNVLLSGGAAVVTDFGIAKALSEARTGGAGATLTQMGTAIGTPAYIAPEQAAGDPNVDHRADIYSYGCMAYELLAGRSPFAERTPQRMMAAHMAESPRPIAEFRAELPEALARMVMQCLEKEPSARPQSASDLMTALDAASTSGASHSAMPALLIGGRAMFLRALGIYAVSFVAVAILAKAAIVGVGLPDWVFPGALVVMALGLPVILFTAYTQYVARRAIIATPAFTPNGSVAPPTHGTMATMAMKASPHLSWRRTMFGGLYALAAFVALIGVFMGLRAFGIGPAGSLFSSGRLSAKAPVLITDFATTNTDSALGAVVSDAVRAGIGQSSVISLVRPAQVASTLRLMQKPATTRLDLPLARDVAQRNGVQAIVDGTVTGVAGGYIVALRLVTADSGVELASFRETGDGPRGLIDAADKVARELRGKIGESFKSVQGTPPLAQVTTSSLEALRDYSIAQRANNLEGDPARAIRYWREAARIDSTFAGAWTGIATGLYNMNGPRASIDSALDHAYRMRGHLTEAERARVDAQYAGQGPHRDRGRAVALFIALAKISSTPTSSLVNAGEGVRSWRDLAAAESLNHVALTMNPANSIAALNVVQLRIDRNQVDSANAALAAIKQRNPKDAGIPIITSWVDYARGDYGGVQAFADSKAKSADPDYRQEAQRIGSNLATLRGQLATGQRLLREASRGDSARPGELFRDSLTLAARDAWFHGASDKDVARIDAVVAQYPLRTLALTDRPYLELATEYARAHRPDRAKAILAAYAEASDTAMRRLQSADFHNAMGEIALASNDPKTALVEFRKGDVGYDGKPATECASCAEFNYARAFDAANMADSAIAAYERFINTPYWDRLSTVDPIGLAGAHKRLGELYEAKGNTSRAIAHYQQFVDLWKNADRELQPLVAEAKRKLARLTASERR